MQLVIYIVYIIHNEFFCDLKKRLVFKRNDF